MREYYTQPRAHARGEKREQGKGAQQTAAADWETCPEVVEEQRCLAHADAPHGPIHLIGRQPEELTAQALAVGLIVGLEDHAVLERVCREATWLRCRFRDRNKSLRSSWIEVRRSWRNLVDIDVLEAISGWTTDAPDYRGVAE
jgi:hypothetical protein